jgi:hypothetical protein
MTLTALDYLALLALISLPFFSVVLGISYLINRRRLGSNKMPVPKLYKAATADIIYKCDCKEKGKVVLGKAFSSWMLKIIIVMLSVSLITSLLQSSFDSLRYLIMTLVFMIPILLLVYLPIYKQIQKEMKKAGHTDSCGKKAALRALPYQSQNSWFLIEK